jgi:hypothetical protein
MDTKPLHKQTINAGRNAMHVVMRSHPSTEVANILLKHKDEIEKLLRGVPGLISWVLVRTGDSYMTATVCQDKAGCDRSVQVAREWLGKNAMKIQEGEVLLRVT